MRLITKRIRVATWRQLCAVKVKKAALHCCLISAFGSLVVQAKDMQAASLDIDIAVQRTVQWHPAIAEAIGLLMQQNEQITVARAGYYPQISAGVRSGYDNAYPDNRYSQALVLSVSQMLYDFGKVSGEVRVARAGVEQYQAGLLLTIDQIIREVIQAVIEIQRYQQLVSVASLQLQALEQVAGLARERHSKGASSLSDVVQSESRIEGARALHLQHKAQLERWRGTLAMLMGDMQVPHISARFPDHHGACNAAADIQTAPAILVAQAQRQQALARIDQAQAQLLPTISLDPTATHYLDNNPLAGSGRDRTQYAVALNFSVPIDQGGAVKARQRAASQALRSADAGLQQAALTAKQQLLEGQNQQASLQQNLDVLVRRQQLSMQTRDLYRQQYLALGTRPLLDLLNAEQEIYQAQLDRQHTLSDLRQLQAGCLFHSGQLRRIFALQHSRIQGVELQP